MPRAPADADADAAADTDAEADTDAPTADVPGTAHHEPATEAAQSAEHDTLREERADSDPSIAEAGDDTHPHPEHHEDDALAEDGDSTRSTT